MQQQQQQHPPLKTLLQQSPSERLSPLLWEAAGAADGSAQPSRLARLRGEALKSQRNSRRLLHWELDAEICGRPTRMQIFRSWAGGHPNAMILGFGQNPQRSAGIVRCLRSQKDMSFCPECVFDQINTWHLQPRWRMGCYWSASNPRPPSSQ